MNESARLLKSFGYRFVFFPTALERRQGGTDSAKICQVPDPAAIRPEFSIAWQRTTMLPLFHRAWFLRAVCAIDHLPYVPETAALIGLGVVFHQLEERFSVPERPTFIVARLAVPHRPYM